MHIKTRIHSHGQRPNLFLTTEIVSFATYEYPPRGPTWEVDLPRRSLAVTMNTRTDDTYRRCVDFDRSAVRLRHVIVRTYDVVFRVRRSRCYC